MFLLLTVWTTISVGTGIFNCSMDGTTWWQMTFFFGGSFISLKARTRYSVIVDVADGIDTTSLIIFTRIITLVIATGLVVGTVGTGNTLWSA